jgi:hypothetical protein
VVAAEQEADHLDFGRRPEEDGSTLLGETIHQHCRIFLGTTYQKGENNTK